MVKFLRSLIAIATSKFQSDPQSTDFGFGSYFFVALLTASWSGPASADQLSFVPKGPKALAVLTQSIEQARRSIDMTYFIFDACHPSTQVVMELLAKKSREGVHIRILLDAFLLDDEQREILTYFFSKNKIYFRMFNDHFLINPQSNLRTHIKLTLIDDELYFTGGRNIGDDYLSLAPRQNFVDRDVLVRGASALQAKTSFAELWQARSTTRSIVSSAQDFNKLSPAAQTCFPNAGADPATFGKAQVSAQKVSSIKNRLQAYLGNQSSHLMNELRVRSCAQVKFITDKPDFMRPNPEDRGRGPYLNQIRLREKRASQAVVGFIRGTQKKLAIENWSYMPMGLIDKSLAELRARQIPVMVLTNLSAGKESGFDAALSDITTDYAERDTKGSQGVVQIGTGGALQDRFELSPRNAHWKLHGKLMVRDGKDVNIGSFNIDARSYHTNLESVVIVKDCPAFAGDVQASMNDLVQVYQQDANCEKCQQGHQASLLVQLLSRLALQFL